MNGNEESNGNEWLKTHWQNAHVVDHDYTMNRYDYPQYVRDWIKNNWIKYDNKNGGTYYDPEYYEIMT